MSLSRWDASLDIFLPLNQIYKYSQDGHYIIEYSGAKYDLYKIEGGLEFEIILNEPMKGNVISFPVDMTNFIYGKQLPLYEEYPLNPIGWTVNSTHLIDDTGYVVANRPLNIVNSYAIYHASKRDNEYKTGKAYHLDAPFAYDSEKLRVWCDLELTDTRLSIIIPPDFLLNAVYPVVIDPTFGKTAVGATNFGIGDGRMYSSKYTLSENAGDVFSIHTYVYQDVLGTGEYKVGIYEDDTGHSPTRAGDLSNVYTDTTETNPSTPAWNYLNTTGSLDSGDYWQAIFVKEGDGMRFVYDNVASNGGVWHGIVGWGTWASKDPAPYSSNIDAMWSIYATYEIAITDPSNEDLTILNMDDTNYLYSEYRHYNFWANVTKGTNNIDFIGVRFQVHEGSTQNITVYVKNSTLATTVQPADYIPYFDVGTVSRSGDDYTIPIEFDFNCGDLLNGSLYLFANDTSNNLCDWSLQQSDYYNLESDLYYAGAIIFSEASSMSWMGFIVALVVLAMGIIGLIIPIVGLIGMGLGFGVLVFVPDISNDPILIPFTVLTLLFSAFFVIMGYARNRRKDEF